MTNVCLKLSGREITVICNSKQYGTITTTSSNFDETNHDKHKHNNEHAIVAKIVDNSTNKKQLTKRMSPSFHHSQENKEKENDATTQSNKQTDNDSTITATTNSVTESNDTVEGYDEVIVKNEETELRTKTKRAVSVNVAINLKQLIGIEGIDNFSSLNIGQVPMLPPTGNIFDEIILNKNDNDCISFYENRTIFYDISINNFSKSTTSSEINFITEKATAHDSV